MQQEIERRISIFLYESRQKKGLNQTEAAAKIGISQSQYCKIEKNPLKMRAITFLKICELYEITVEQIIMQLLAVGPYISPLTPDHQKNHGSINQPVEEQAKP